MINLTLLKTNVETAFKYSVAGGKAARPYFKAFYKEAKALPQVAEFYKAEAFEKAATPIENQFLKGKISKTRMIKKIIRFGINTIKSLMSSEVSSEYKAYNTEFKKLYPKTKKARSIILDKYKNELSTKRFEKFKQEEEQAFSRMIEDLKNEYTEIRKDLPKQ